MNNQNLAYMILNDSARISEAISTGAAWEIWMQVELILLFRQGGIQATREVPYPPPNGNWHLDALAQDNDGRYAIELKVESANNSGAAVLASAQQDVNKIVHYPAPNPGSRWVVAIGYSVNARNALQGYANDQNNYSIYQEQNSIGVLIITV
ncbi:hypothetical protein L4174_019250 [Photobacterium sp. CCB-ST2H9]|uniref:hypothetical protein n=1 Tax=Photobacterium sp. CCB-ST2H9 TaxID=2912855 RepID=UPI002005261F|nr:hypothetical protein [Photobacterium sp. CCB-ST2H9]UTM60196.1 hypothetical protein L4174_019250 [Photobacterium sp. CCB-ST2H9]